MSVDTLNVSPLVSDIASAAARYLPEPAVTGVGLFQDAVELIKDVGSTVADGSAALGGASSYDLIQMQIQAQQEMQAVTMVSNIEKSKHESKMAAIRNVRVN